jgi:Arc/MetJ-type ribon-helix-helix transcriptional regulator
MSIEPTTRTHVVLPTHLLEQLDKLVGPRHRSEFIADAVAQCLQRARLRKALDAMKDWPEPGSQADQLAEFAEVADEVRRDRRLASNRERWLEDNWYPRPE